MENKFILFKTMDVESPISGNPLITILIVVGGIALLALLAFVVSNFVFKRQKYKRHVKDLDKKFCYLKGLLSGQDAQNVRRLEVISRSNLLYGEIYEKFSSEFKAILEECCKPTEAILVKMRTIISKKDYQNYKVSYTYAKKLVTQFEDRLNAFDKELYNTLKPEEDSRSSSVKVKENYRNIKQKFSNYEKELAIVAPTFEKTFVKIDSAFDKYENLLECADYSEAQELIEKIGQVVGALTHAVNELPNLCSQIEKVIPEKLMLLGNDFIDVEKSGIPLFHLAYKNRKEGWNAELQKVTVLLKELKLSGVQARLDVVSNEIDDLHKQLEQEISDKEFFDKNVKQAYFDANNIEKEFLKIVSKLPEVNQVYVISMTQQNNLELLKKSVNDLGIAKRSLDNYIHSATKQPYSLLKTKLEVVMSDYSVVRQGVDNFKAYIDSIKSNSEDAYELVFSYYYRLKTAESGIEEMNMPALRARYDNAIDKCYGLLNAIDTAVRTKPIDVKLVNEKVEELKSITKILFDDIDKRLSDMKLAESAIVYNNKDRLHQSDVHEKLTKVEQDFFNGDFEKVYKAANEIYSSSHIEDNK